jgi:hypothetical protein
VTLNAPTIVATCNDNGTPSDPSDDTFTYTIEVTGSNTGATYSISGGDMQAGLSYGVVNGPFGPFPISGGDLTITITDVDDAGCQLVDQTVSAPATCSNTCALNAPTIVATCNDNGTPSDPSDDTFTYTINVTGANTGASYSISGDDTQSGLSYGVVNGPYGPFPITGGDLTITITDVDDAGCQLLNQTVSAPATCSNTCALNAPTIVATCNDNGTPSDPSDDTFTYTINVTGANTGASYSISGDDTQSGLSYGVVNGPYGPFPIAGGDLTITITDVDDAGCQLLNQTVSAPATCSNTCALNAPTIVATCNDNGTPSDPSDDTFTYTINVTGANTGASYSISGDDTQSGLSYGVVNGPYGPFPIAGGDLTITITDVDDAGCQLIDQTVTAPATCSNTCDLNAPTIVATCNDNGTPSDPSDDTFTYTIEVTGANTGATYSISDDDTQAGLSYGVVNGPFGPFNIADGDLTITITDVDDAGCQLIDQTVTAPATCSNTCDLNAPTIVATCNDNGTPSDPSDDTFTYTIEVTGANTGATYSISGDDTQAGLSYGVVNGPFGPFNIADGDLTITITDVDDAGCQLIDQTVTAPATCSNTCDLADAGEAAEACNDNGTIYDPSDDYITISLNPTGANLTTYTVTANNGGIVTLAGGGAATGLNYGVSLDFRLQDGSADGLTTYTITIAGLLLFR